MSATSPRIIHVAGEQANQTVAAVLRSRLTEAPWSHVQRLVRTRHVMVNGNLCLDAARRLRAGDVVKLLPHPTAPPAREDDVRIRYLDKHMVVVEKPSGMTSVRHAEEQNWSAKRRQQQPTLEDLLPRIIAKREAGQRSGGARRQGARAPTRTPPVRPVHRLDRDTSGLMAFARTVPAERNLAAQFRAHTTQRTYLAIVLGDVAATTIRSRLVRDRGDGRRGSTSDEHAGKTAVTHVRPLERLGAYTLVECRLETGRTHQIRIHLAENGHMVLGEKLYDKPLAGKPIKDTSHAPRLALHAAELAVTHPTTGESLTFQMPLPADLAEFLARLRREAQRGTKKGGTTKGEG